MNIFLRIGIEKSLLRILEQADADIMCFGHTHKPYHRVLRGNQDHYRHAINIGSLGKPKDGNPQGGYILLNITENSTVSDSNSIQEEFIRFSHDVKKAALAVENSLLPNEYADMLRKAY